MPPATILKDVLTQLLPRPEDHHVVYEVDAFLTKLGQQLRKNRIDAKPVLGGSFAKDTWLTGDYDVDVFVAFDLRHKERNLSDMLAKALKPWRVDRVHGSRDYFQIKGRINYEIIPVLAIKKSSDAQNVTDFSPKHVAWVNTQGRKLKDDIRLLKKFCKAQRVYGAESYIRGFSGHVVDILIIHHGGFLKLLKAATKWHPKTILDHNNAYKGKALLVLNESKIQGPLVLIDPVQPDRNAAAALTQENYDKFIAAAKAFLTRPSPSFFTEKKPDFDVLKKKGAVLVHTKTVREKEDVAGTKMVKAFEFLKQRLLKNEFHLVDTGWNWDKKATGTFWFLTKEKTLPSTMKREGPPVKLEKNAKEFRKKYKRVKSVKGRLVAIVAREFRTPQAVVKAHLKDDYLKDKGSF
ncbi:nucleotidyltransferase domain-containing protein [Candidatus Woesearchaeota archaeon]|nr:nucleotidyltransferase domain-containing protein [Candidatus Woesearchaeota archaeon]